jgi:hypothetical protein
MTWCPPARRIADTAPHADVETDPAASSSLQRLPPHGFTCTVHHLDAVVGGTFRMSFRNFTTGHAHPFGSSPHPRMTRTRTMRS